MLIVPDYEVLTEVMDKYFSEDFLPEGSYTREDEGGSIYVFSGSGNLLLHMMPDVWLQLIGSNNATE